MWNRLLNMLEPVADLTPVSYSWMAPREVSMSHSRCRQLSFNVWHVLWLAGLSACATGVTQEFEDESSPIGKNTGGTPSGSEAGSTSVPKAGSTGSGGGSNPFGGSANTAGKDGGGTAGSDVGEGGAGSEVGGAGGGASAGSGGASAGSGGGGGTGSGPCGCGKTLAWVDNTVLNWATGDCVTVTAAMMTTTYKYTGTKAQTYANGQCNPSKQEAWCTDNGNDYKFMICP